MRSYRAYIAAALATYLIVITLIQLHLHHQDTERLDYERESHIVIERNASNHGLENNVVDYLVMELESTERENKREDRIEVVDTNIHEEGDDNMYDNLGIQRPRVHRSSYGQGRSSDDYPELKLESNRTDFFSDPSRLVPTAEDTARVERSGVALTYSEMPILNRGKQLQEGHNFGGKSHEAEIIIPRRGSDANTMTSRSSGRNMAHSPDHTTHYNKVKEVAAHGDSIMASLRIDKKIDYEVAISEAQGLERNIAHDLMEKKTNQRANSISERRENRRTGHGRLIHQIPPVSEPAADGPNPIGALKSCCVLESEGKESDIGPNAAGRSTFEFQELEGGHYVYSAYYDDRLPGRTYIRVLALLRQGDLPDIYCHFPREGGDVEDPNKIRLENANKIHLENADTYSEIINGRSNGNLKLVQRDMLDKRVTDETITTRGTDGEGIRVKDDFHSLMTVRDKLYTNILDYDKSDHRISDHNRPKQNSDAEDNRKIHQSKRDERIGSRKLKDTGRKSTFVDMPQQDGQQERSSWHRSKPSMQEGRNQGIYDSNQLLTYRSILTSAYEMCENHNMEYGGWIMSCEVPAPLHAHTTPFYDVILTLNQSRLDTNVPFVRLSVVRTNVKPRDGQTVEYSPSASVESKNQRGINDKSRKINIDPSNAPHNDIINRDQKSYVDSAIDQQHSDNREARNNLLLEQDQHLHYEINRTLKFVQNMASKTSNYADMERTFHKRQEYDRNQAQETHNATAKKEQSAFAVCVPPLFGHIPSTTLVEFIEMNRLLGVEHIVFYRSEVQREAERTLDFYAEQGFVSVIPWTIPVPVKSVWYRAQLLAVNDCLYRTMSLFSYVAFHDIDEFIVPHKHASWAELIETLALQGTSAPSISDPSSRSRKRRRPSRVDSNEMGKSNPNRKINEYENGENKKVDKVRTTHANRGIPETHLDYSVKIMQQNNSKSDGNDNRVRRDSSQFNMPGSEPSESFDDLKGVDDKDRSDRATSRTRSTKSNPQTNTEPERYSNTISSPTRDASVNSIPSNHSIPASGAQSSNSFSGAVERSEPCGYSFQSAFFDPFLSAGMTGGHVMYNLESDLRTKVFSRVRTKILVRPRLVFELGIHHVSRPLVDDGRHVVRHVSTDVAFVHHYRRCTNEFDPTMLCHVFTHDDSLARFVPSLRHSVHGALWALKERGDRRRGRG